jgi:hypothetical protein
MPPFTGQGFDLFQISVTRDCPKWLLVDLSLGCRNNFLWNAVILTHHFRRRLREKFYGADINEIVSFPVVIGLSVLSCLYSGHLLHNRQVLQTLRLDVDSLHQLRLSLSGQESAVAAFPTLRVNLKNLWRHGATDDLNVFEFGRALAGRNDVFEFGSLQLSQ